MELPVTAPRCAKKFGKPTFLFQSVCATNVTFLKSGRCVLKGSKADFCFFAGLVSNPAVWAFHMIFFIQYSVKAFVASKGGDSASLIPKLKRLAEVMGPAIKVDIHYVLDSSSTGYYSPRGHSEVIGDMIGKCAMKQNPQAKVFLPFLVCMMQNVTLVPNNLFNCTRLHPVDYERVRNCVYAEGQTLLSNDMAAGEHYRVDNAPRVFLDDRYYNPGVDSTYESYEYAMCYVFSNPTRPFPWFIFFIMGAVVCLVLVIFFTIKRWSNASFLDTLQSLFLWNSPSGSVADDAIDTLLYLRAYGHEFPEDEFDEDEEELEEAEEPPPPEPEPEVSREEDRAERRRRRRERRRNRRQEREAAHASRSEAESTPETVTPSNNEPSPSSSEPVVESHPAYYESSDDEDTLLPR
jgi:hypothetical protein